MSRAWLQHAILRLASLLSPADQRGQWMADWRTELWYVPETEALRFCLGSFRDALWMRRNNPIKTERRGWYVESPITCLAILAALAAIGILIALRIEKSLPFPEAHGAPAAGGFGAMLVMYSMLAVVALAIGGRRPAPSRSRTLRGWMFLGLKLLLALPILQSTMLAIIVAAPFLTMGLFLMHALFFRWLFADQRRRCPICLRLLKQPVRIGNPSQTFLEWYGAESVCSRGHGLLHDPELLASYAANPQWLVLDSSWSGL